MKVQLMRISICCTLLLFSWGAVAQQVYHIPFASAKNTIELTIANSSDIVASTVKVTPVSTPSWVHFSPTEHVIQMLKPHGDQPVQFSFGVDMNAPVNKEQRLTFTISMPNGEKWTKQIAIAVAVPERFELFQNFPNPFNPTTQLGYTLPKDANVLFKVYDLLGREVMTVADGPQEAGYRSVVFDASNLPSGVYFYRLHAGSFSAVKKMMVMK